MCTYILDGTLLHIISVCGDEAPKRIIGTHRKLCLIFFKDNLAKTDGYTAQVSAVRELTFFLQTFK